MNKMIVRYLGIVQIRLWYLWFQSLLFHNVHFFVECLLGEGLRPNVAKVVWLVSPSINKTCNSCWCRCLMLLMSV